LVVRSAPEIKMGALALGVVRAGMQQIGRVTA
jgi:hypothetical protein